MSLHYRRLWVGVRAPRVAMLFPAGPGWESRAANALSLASRFWGGAGTILVPAVAGEVPAIFRPVIRAFDPDMLASYPATLAERHAMEGLDPPAAAGGEMVGWDDEHIGAAVAHWCAPFHDLDGIVSRAVGIDEVSRPLVDVRDLIEPGSRYYDLDTTDLEPQLGLRVGMRLGTFSQSAAELAARHRSQVVRLSVTEDDLPSLHQFAVTGEVLTTSWDLHSRFQTAMGLAATPATPPALAVGDLVSRSAFSLTMSGLGWLSRSRLATPLIVAGASDVDFCLSQALRVLLGDHVLTLAPDWLDDAAARRPTYLALGTALRRRRQWSGRKWSPVKVISASLDNDALEVLAAELSTRLPKFGFVATRHEVVGGVPTAMPDLEAALTVAGRLSAEDLARHRLLGDPGRIAEPVALPATGDGLSDAIVMETELLTPKPSAVTFTDVESTWVVDVGVVGAQTPARYLLPESDLLGAVVNDEVRIRSGRDGLSYRSHNEFMTLSGWTLDMRLVRPQLRVPSAQEVFHRLLTASGFEATMSQAGRLSARAAALWPSVEDMASDLMGPVGRLIDAHMNPDSEVKGIHLRNENRVRYLTFAAAEHALESSTNTVRSTLDRLLGLGVVRRGLLLRCARCNWSAFYRLDVIGSSFVCARCDNENAVEQRAWKSPADEPLWFYDMDQALRAALLDDAAVPIVALSALMSKHRSCLWTWEQEVAPAGQNAPVAEVDLWAIVDGKVLVGEAKSTPHLSLKRKEKGNILGKVMLVAEAVDADIVCFATSATAWDPADLTMITETVARSGRELLVLDGLGGAHGLPGS